MQEKKMREKYTSQATKIGLGIIIILLLFYIVGLKESISTLMSINPYYIILAYLIHSTTWLTRTLRLRTLFRDQKIKGMKSKDIFKINLTGYTLNLVLPFKLGDIGRMYLFHTEAKIPLKESISSVIYTRIFDILALALLGMASITLLIEKSTGLANYNYIALFILIALALTSVTSSHLQKTISGFAEKKHPKIASAIRSFRLTKKARINALFYSMLIWIADGLTIDFVFLGLNQDIPLPVVFMGLVVGNMVKSIPTTPGGIGLFEGSMALLFMSFGIDANIAIVASTVDHFIKNTTTLALGIPSMMSYDYDTETLKNWSGKIKERLKNGNRQEQITNG